MVVVCEGGPSTGCEWAAAIGPNREAEGVASGRRLGSGRGVGRA